MISEIKPNHVNMKPREGINVSEIDKYVVSFFFDSKSLKLFFSFLKLKISIKLEKIRILILQFDLGNPRHN